VGAGWVAWSVAVAEGRAVRVAVGLVGMSSGVAVAGGVAELSCSVAIGEGGGREVSAVAVATTAEGSEAWSPDGRAGAGMASSPTSRLAIRLTNNPPRSVRPMALGQDPLAEVLFLERHQVCRGVLLHQREKVAGAGQPIGVAALIFA